MYKEEIEDVISIAIPGSKRKDKCWLYIEDVKYDVIRPILEEYGYVVEPHSTNYPDIECSKDKFKFAIDAKSSRSDTPAFDVSNLSTHELSHDEYRHEFLLIARYKPSLISPTVKFYFGETYKFARIGDKGRLSIGSNGIKLRPLNWKDMDSEVCHFADKQSLLKYVREEYKIRNDSDHKYGGKTAKVIMDTQIETYIGAKRSKLPKIMRDISQLNQEDRDTLLKMLKCQSTELTE